MKWFVYVLVSFLLLQGVSAQSLYQQDSLTIEMSVEGEFDLVSQDSSSTVKEVTTEILLAPQDDFRQEIESWESGGDLDDGLVLFKWNSPTPGTYDFGYTAVITTQNTRHKIKEKIPFPLSGKDIEGFEEYLIPTKTIDSDNEDIIEQAAQLVEGEDDLFAATFKLAEWVESNVEYDLNTVTEKASQKASWVLENKQGVCDEMTSLFIAMARSVGIPARFVTGVSYTTSELFDEPWQPHGWAEVYIPGKGWVSFDITFGEYGYIDVTHIKLRDGFDPAEPATRYEWLARDVTLESSPLDFNLQTLNTGNFVPEAINLEMSVLGEEVESGSYNLVKGILKNTEDYYAATTLTLAAPDEINILGRNRRTILLHPKETRETYWIVKVPNALSEKLIYTFPLLIYSEKNVSVQGGFKVQSGKATYSQSEIEELTIQDEEKSYSRKIVFDCEYEKKITLDDKSDVLCSIQNIGNTFLSDVTFCIKDVCEKFDLDKNQKREASITLENSKPGWQKIILSAENEIVEKKSSLVYQVFDPPTLSLDVTSSDTLRVGDDFTLSLDVETNSFSVPRNVTIILKGAGFENTWAIESLSKTEELSLFLEDYKVASTNTFVIDASWSDAQGEKYSLVKEFSIKGNAESVKEKLELWINSFLHLFM